MTDPVTACTPECDALQADPSTATGLDRAWHHDDCPVPVHHALDVDGESTECGIDLDALPRAHGYGDIRDATCAGCRQSQTAAWHGCAAQHEYASAAQHGHECPAHGTDASPVPPAEGEEAGQTAAWKSCAHRADYASAAEHERGCAYHRGEVDEWGLPVEVEEAGPFWPGVNAADVDFEEA